MLLVENTVGAGAQLGSRFEELHAIREYAGELTDLPIGFLGLGRFGTRGLEDSSPA